MADRQKRNDSSINVKEKDHLQDDLDIGNDFFSWKSISVGEGDGLDFDLTPVSKGNKKTFNFDKADMDFNLDADFGKMSSFNLDMPDLDMSPPLKKDAKSKEKLQESSSGKKKEKADDFDFGFDFDNLDNFSFDSTSRKEGTRTERDKNNKESSPNRSGCKYQESSIRINETGSRSALKDAFQKPSLPESRVTFDMDLEPTREISPSNLAMDDGVTPEHSAGIDERASDNVKGPPETKSSREMANDSPSENIDETSGDSSSEASSEVSCMDANVRNLDGEQDANMILVVGSTCDKEHTSKASQDHQAVAHSENINGERAQDGIENHLEDDRGRTELGQTKSHVENSCISGAVSEIPCDTPSRENQEPSQDILKSSIISQPADPVEKQIENIMEPLINCSRPLIQSEKSECTEPRASLQSTFSSLSSKQMGFAQQGLVKERNGDATQSDRILTLQCSKTLLRGIIPQIQSHKSSSGLKIHRDTPVPDGLRNEAKSNDSGIKHVQDMVKTKPASGPGKYGKDTPATDGLRNENKSNDSSIKQDKDMVITKPASRQGDMSTKDLDTLSMETNSKAANNSGNPKKIASKLLNESNPAQEHRKPPDLSGLKLSRLSIDSKKSPILRESKSVGNSSEKSVLISKIPSGISHLPDKWKQTTSTLSGKRTLEDAAADSTALHPSKRLSPSVATCRNFVETSEKVLDKKTPIHNRMEDHRIKNTTRNSQLTPFYTPHEVKTKEVEILSSTTYDSNIKLAEACSKELDDLCDILRKKNDEAREVLVRATMNSNKLLLLNTPQFDEKVRAIQNLFAQITLDGIRG